MTKDWDSVRSKIRDLSVNQKKSLEEVKVTMETEHRFRASTRAYRMKLKEWGYTRHKRRRDTSDQTRNNQGTAEEREVESADESDASAIIDERALGGKSTLLEEAEDLLPAVCPWAQGSSMVSDIVMEMLATILESDSQKLEQLILANPDHVNLPIGTPFSVHGGRFFNHPAMQQCVILEHANQTLLDIACALPSGPVIWVLVANGANGSTHPLGTDLAFHNAIKNGRSITVQSLLFTNRSSVNGIPGTSWKPLLQATFWNVPDVVRILLDRGANVNDSAPPLDGMPLKTALQLALDRRANNYLNQPIRERSEKCLKMLLDAGANIHVPPADDLNALTPFETFIKPWQSNPHWAAHLSPIDMDCLESFVRKGADIQVPFNGFPCSAPSANTFEHQVLWHSTPIVARLLIDHVAPSPGANGSNILHEVLGSCLDAKRHPADTLRDIEVLLQRGADPNLPGQHGLTPLRTCIDRCPAVDLLTRLQALLDGGADPELKGSDGIQPFVYAARTFEEPLLSQVLHILVAKFRGRSRQVWHERYFPIPTEPTLAQVLLYSNQNGGFAAEIQRTVPEDVGSVFQRAAFCVASRNFLNAVEERAKIEPDRRMTVQDIDELRHMIALRQASGLPPFKFGQELILSLLMPSLQPSRSNIGGVIDVTSPTSDITAKMSMLPGSMNGFSFPASLGPNLPTPLVLDTPQPPPTSRRASSSSTSSNDSAMSFFIPTTTQIRWPTVDIAMQPGDLKKAAQMILKYKCKSCKDGNLLTKAEFLKHDEEHLHTITCCEVGCKRRFCIAERGERGL